VKIGVISDIHGDLDGLQKALALLKTQQAARVVCAGDLVNRGAHPNEVVALIRDAAIPCVRGNHDDYAALSPLPDAADVWLRGADPDNHTQLLSGETREFLRALPLTCQFEWEGKRVLLAHGAPWSNNVSLFPVSGAAVFRRTAEEAKADVVILGHTHQPMAADVGSVRIVNAGAIWRDPDDTARTCGVLTLPGGAFEVYDIDRGRTVKFATLRV
jgi:putative phosphoesterase